MNKFYQNKPAFTKHQLADQMRNYIHIEDKYLEGLSTYNMLHMTGKGFAKRLKDGQLQRVEHGAQFNVIYHGCTPFNVKRAHEIRCSFREAAAEYGIEPVVLVQIVIPFTEPQDKE